MRAHESRSAKRGRLACDVSSASACGPCMRRDGFCAGARDRTGPYGNRINCSLRTPAHVGGPRSPRRFLAGRAYVGTVLVAMHPPGWWGRHGNRINGPCHVPAQSTDHPEGFSLLEMMMVVTLTA